MLISNMTIRKPKASVAIESLESKTKSRKKKDKEKTSVIACSDSSLRKWKVSEAIVPVMSEIERFSLKVVSENSATNHSFGSLNETFEKNIHFNFQNSFGKSSSIESRNKKSSVSAAPLIRSISPITCTQKIDQNPINPTMIESPKFNLIEQTPCSVQLIKEIQTNPLIGKFPENLNIIGKKLSHIEESQELDIDDVQLSIGEEDKPSIKSSISYHFLTDENPMIILESTSMNMNPVIVLESTSMNIIEELENTQGSKCNRSAKETAKDNISKQCKLFNDFRCPVDIDASQYPEKQIFTKRNLRKRKSPPGTLEIVELNESSGQQSKLCDVSKAYLHSQDSSLISSPIEIENPKSAVNLPGRVSYNKRQNNSLDSKASAQVNIDNDSKKRFFKSSFHERRLQEIDRITSLNGDKSNKNTDTKVVKKTKPKPKPKQKKSKKKKVTRKGGLAQKKLHDYEDTIAMLLTGNSTKEQTDKITIDDSDNSKFDQPIEKARNIEKHSDEDLFSFTPQNVRKRKIKRITNPIKTRCRKSSEIYDVNSDLSSPLQIRKSSLSYKSIKSTGIEDECISSNQPLKEIIVNFEYDLKQMKNIQFTMHSRLNQFKNILSNSF